MRFLRLPMALVFSIACLLFSTDALAGAKVKLADGDLSAFTSAQTIQVVFVYDGMMVGTKTEEAYVSEKIADKNADVAGSGEYWHGRWLADRELRFHPKFFILMNRDLAERSITVGDAPDSPTLLMTVTVTRTEPGFYSYVVNKPAEVDFDITVTATGAPDTVLAHFTVDRAPGRSVVSMADTGERISEAYAKAGKDLAKYINR